MLKAKARALTRAGSFPGLFRIRIKEVNVSDLVLYTIGPIIHAVQKTGRRLRLKREQVIISAASPISGREEFVVVDRVAVGNQKICAHYRGQKSIYRTCDGLNFPSDENCKRSQ